MTTALETECEMESKTHQNRVGGEASTDMEHNEAIEMMASEKYLLDELTPELRDAYEEHYFGCAECAQDVQLGAAFIDHAKVLLPEMMSSRSPVQAAEPARTAPARKDKAKREWFAWLQPAILVPAFACLLALVGYQNLVVYPALQAAATEPRILPASTVLHDGTRSATQVIDVDPNLGSTIAVELPAGVSYSTYKLDCYDSNGKFLWTRSAQNDAKGDDTISFWLSSKVKLDTYKLVISGVGAGGEVTEVKQQKLELQSKK